jgi:hypothetical protein
MTSHLVTRKIFLYLYLAMLGFILPAIKQAEAQTGMQLHLAPTETDVYAGGVFDVEITVAGAEALYGLEITCQVDPALLTWQTAQYGDFFTESLMGTNSVDPEAGTWTGAVSQKNPAPALSGGGLFATLTFEAVTPGEVTISCEPLAVDRDGNELPIAVASEPFSIGFAGGVAGRVIYQGRTDHSGIEVQATGAFTNSVQTDAIGQFEISELDRGDYTVEADAELHLPSCALITPSGGEIVTLRPIALAGGDTDDSDAIKINDATLVGSNFGLSASSSPPMNPNADINADGQVNVQDLSILGGNFGREGCQEWLSASPTEGGSAPETSTTS